MSERFICYECHQVFWEELDDDCADMLRKHAAYNNRTLAEHLKFLADNQLRCQKCEELYQEWAQRPDGLPFDDWKKLQAWYHSDDPLLDGMTYSDWLKAHGKS